MFRKIGFAIIVVAGGLFLLSNTRIASYGGTAFKKVRQATQKQVPVEFEIERLQHELSQLIPDMKKSLTGVAEEIVAVENLKEDIDRVRVAQNDRKRNIFAMKEQLKNNTERVTLNNRTVSANRVREMIDNEVASCKNIEKEIETKEKLLEARERSLDLARRQISSVRAQKQELELQIAQLQADVKNLRLAQTKSVVQIDDSRLAHIKTSLQELRNRLKVEKTEGELHGQLYNEINAPDTKIKTNEQVIKEAEAYLGDATEEGKVVTEKRQ